MIVTGIMIAAMREKGNQAAVVVPVCYQPFLTSYIRSKANCSRLQLVLVSINGRFARVIQAHVALEEQRLKVRYSQYYNFENCSQRQMDLFLRWTLSSPLLEPKPQPEAEIIPPDSSYGDTAPIVTISNTRTEESHIKESRLLMEALVLAS